MEAQPSNICTSGDANQPANQSDSRMDDNGGDGTTVKNQVDNSESATEGTNSPENENVDGKSESKELKTDESSPKATAARETNVDNNSETEALDDQCGHVEPNVVILEKTQEQSSNTSSSSNEALDNQGSSEDEEATIIVVGDEDNDGEDDLDDCVIDIRDNANDEDQFAFEENSGANGISGQCAFPGRPLNVKIPGEEIYESQQGGDDINGDDGNNEDENAAANRVSFSEEDNLNDEYQYDHHHIQDHYGGSRSESYEDDDDDDECDKSLNILLLEEICEEAASMTIKEALIHSLKPNVRAGLSTAHLRLSESEILNLEGYCEDFVGGLIKDLLRRTSLLQNENTETQKNVVQATTIKKTAKQLSSMDLKQLKVYCDHFVHNVIAESIIDSSMIAAKQQHQADQVAIILHMFQDSEELQDYFTGLTTDIVRLALINVVTKEQLEGTDDTDTTQSSETDFSENTSYSGDHEFESHGDDGFDFDDDHSFGLPLPEQTQGKQVHSQHTQESHRNGDSYQMKNSKQASTRSKRRKLPQQPGDTPLEFDMDWVEGALHEIGGAEQAGPRQKIIMRELEFDDHENVGGTELLAPVFLAIAEENEDDSDFQGMRRKAQSIEDLCDYIEEEKEPPRKRSSSLNQARPKRKQRPRPPPDSFRDYIQDEEKPSIEDELEPAPPDEDFIESDPDTRYQEDQEETDPEDQEGSYTEDQEESYQEYQEESYQDDQEESYPEDQEESYPEDQEESYQEYQEESYQDDQEESYSDNQEEPDPELEFQAERDVQSPNSLEMTKTIQEKGYHAYDDDQFRWHTIRVNNREKVLDLRLIEPYMKVITHGGVHMPSRAVIVVVAACYLPDKSKRNYDFLMEQLFFYLISTLELLATADEYFLVYLNGGTTQANMPGLPWMKRFYQHIEGGLKKQMIKMFIVHSNFWLKTVVRFAKAFVGTNFWSKLEFVKSLDDLSLQIPTEFMYLPDEVIRCDPKYKHLHNL